jgi:hypothetical protein
MLRAGMLLGLLLPLFSRGAAAQAPQAAAGGWEFVVGPYLISSTMSGTVGLGNVSATVDASPSDIFSHLQFGAMVYFEARNPVWAVALDGIYMNLGQTATTPLGKVDAGVEQGALMTAGYRRVRPWAEVMVGGQLNILSASLDGSSVNRSNTQVWFDPLVGGRLTAKELGRWRLSLQGHVGGFGVGSTFAWQLLPSAAWRASRNVEVSLAYRAMGLDYTTGSGTRKFRYDVTTFGPQIGVGFRF